MHAKLFGLLSELAPSEDGVEGAIYVGPDLEILVFNQIVENLEQLDVGILTLVFACASQRQIHQQGRGVLNGVVREIFAFSLQHTCYPLYHVQLDHHALRLLAQRKLLECAKGIASEVGVALLAVKHLYEDLYQILLLKQVSTSQALAGKGVHQGHSIL